MITKRAEGALTSLQAILMRIALIHDFLVHDGGAERVLRAIQEVYPKAPTFVLVHNRREIGELFADKDIRTSFLQQIPFGVSHYQWFLSLMPLAIEQFNLMEYEVVISSSSAFAKGVITAPKTLHICYCHTPTRYLWTDTHTYIKELPCPSFVKKILPLALSRVRLWDRAAADRVDLFVANSLNVARRIKKYYRRESEVIHPPVEIEKFSLGEPKNYFLAGGRLVPYKRFDLVVQAFNKLGIPLKIFGEGPAEEYLFELAKDNIEFLGKVSDEERAALYRQAIAFIHPQIEDFGITAVESMASGRPVIAYGEGGALETILPNQTGVFFEEQTWESLADAVLHFFPERFDPKSVRGHALQFSKEVFQDKMRQYVGKTRQQFS